MKIFLQNQNGSAMVLALLIIVFLTIILSGLMPLANSQILHSSMNNDTIEAQYAAEAGAKRAIVGIKNNRTDWAWANGREQNDFVDNTKAKYYITSIVPPLIKGDSPKANTTYTITSNGYVGNAHKKVVVTVKNTTSSPFSYASFSKGDMLIQNPQINGDIFSNGDIRTTSSAKMVFGTAYSKTQSIENQSNISNGYKQITDPLTLDINALMSAIPTLSMIGTDLRKTWKNGQWGSNTYPLSSGSYYYDGSYDLNGHSYSIASGQNVTIYVKGKFSLMSKSNITLDGGNLTVYSTGDIDFNQGSILGNINSNIQIFSNGTVNLSSNSYINGGIVNLLANNANHAYQAIGFNGGSINKNLSGATSKVSANGLVSLNDVSVISGQGTGMLVSTGAVNLNGGSAANTIIVAGGNVQGNSGSTVAGIYTNGTLTMTGATATYNESLIQSLGLIKDNLNSSTVVSWSDQ